MTDPIGFIRVPKTASTMVVSAMAGMQHRDATWTWCGGHWSGASLMDHGHGHRWLTMIRDPMQAYVSFYYMYKRVTADPNWTSETPTPERNPIAFQPHYQADIEAITSATTVDEYLATCPRNKLYAYYYGGMDPLTFDFVGSVDNIPDSFQLLRNIFGIIPVEESLPAVNVNPAKEPGEDYPMQYDPVLFRQENAEDYYYYDLALQRFQQLRVEHGLA